MSPINMLIQNKHKLKALVFLILLSACASIPLPKALQIERPPRLGIIGFKITAPINHLSSIRETPQTNLAPEQEKALITKELHDIEDWASSYIIEALKKEKTIEPVLIPDGLFGTQRGGRPTESQIDMLRKELGLDAVLYGEIPSYGKTRLIYPILGESLDITGETIIIGLATKWNTALIFGNIGFELLTSTPLWFGGAYIFGFSFRPVTVKAWAFSTENGKEIWHKSVDKLVSRKELREYPKPERSKKEIQLNISLRRALDAIAKSLSK